MEAVSSRRVMTLAMALFSAIRTVLRMSRISPGRMMSLTPAWMNWTPYSSSFF